MAMACDRFVYWRGEKKRPSKVAIRKALIGYIGGAGKVYWKANRFFAYPPGVPSDPFPGLGPPVQDTRWFEVYLHEDAIDVITRMADEFTMVVAEGFAALCARYWQGERDPD
jgi:hypothetical protein